MGELLVQMAKTGEREDRGGDRKSKFQNGTLKLDVPWHHQEAGLRGSGYEGLAPGMM
jgi:hypothetical protein